MWDELAKAAGYFGVSIEFIYSMSPRHFALYCKGRASRRKQDELDEWYRNRWHAQVVINALGVKIENAADLIKLGDEVPTPEEIEEMKQLANQKFPDKLGEQWQQKEK